MRSRPLERAFTTLFLLLAGAGCGTSVVSIDSAVADTRLDAGITCDSLRRPTGMTTVEGDFGATSVPIALDDLCVAYAEALCTPPPGCGCGTTPLNCSHFAIARCSGTGGALSPEMRASIDLGRAVYDEAAGGRVVEAIVDASSDCAGGPALVDLDFLIARTRAIHGEIAAGAPCDPAAPFECVAGSSCVDSGDFVFVCSEVRAMCAAFGVCAGTGLHAPRFACVGDPCDLGAPPGSDCGPTTSIACATVCRGEGADLACACPVDDGGACAIDEECQSGDCVEGTCGAPAARLGDACAAGQACAEGTCAGGLCRSWQCAGGWY